MVGPAPPALSQSPMLPLLHTLQRWCPSSMVLFVCGLLALLSPRSALAETTRVVLLTEAESSAQPLDAHLLGALRGQLQELHVEVLVVAMPDEPLADTARSARRIARAERALGVIWLEAPASGLSVFLYDSSGHLYARDLRPDGSAVSQSEAIAIILRSAIAALPGPGPMYAKHSGKTTKSAPARAARATSASTFSRFSGTCS